jgi:hypothetical protein
MIPSWVPMCSSKAGASDGVSADSLAKARLEVIEGEGSQGGEWRARRSELSVRMTLWSYTTLTDLAVLGHRLADNSQLCKTSGCFALLRYLSVVQPPTLRLVLFRASD